MTYIKSKDIKVYPTAWRGKAVNDLIFNPESTLPVEDNSTNLHKYLTTYDSGNYVITDTFKVADISYFTEFKFVLGGYVFTINNISDYFTGKSNVFAVIKVIPKGLNGGEDVNNVSVVGNTLSNMDSNDDILDSSTYDFQGLSIQDGVLSEADNTTFTYGLQLLVEGSVPESSKLRLRTDNIANINASGSIQSNNIKTSFYTNRLDSPLANIYKLNVTGVCTLSQLFAQNSSTATLGSASTPFATAHIKTVTLNVLQNMFQEGITLKGDMFPASKGQHLGTSQSYFNYIHAEFIKGEGEEPSLDGFQIGNIYQVNTGEVYVSAALYNGNSSTSYLKIGSNLGLSGNTYPLADDNYDLGSYTSRFSTIHTRTLRATDNFLSGWLYVSQIAYDSTSTAYQRYISISSPLKVRANIIPEDNTTPCLGDSSHKFLQGNFSNLVAVNITAASSISTSYVYAYNGSFTNILFTSSLNARYVSASIISAAQFNAVCDRRLKTNVNSFDYNRSLLDLSVYTFDYINGPKNNIGIMAQDLQEIYPQLVSEDENGYLNIKETKLVYLLMKEVKNLKQEITELKKIIYRR